MIAIETITPYIDVIFDEETVEILSPKVIELRSKIHDEDYMNNAIQRIAQVISKKLVQNPEELKLTV
mgnify:FL=1